MRHTAERTAVRQAHQGTTAWGAVDFKLDGWEVVNPLDSSLYETGTLFQMPFSSFQLQWLTVDFVNGGFCNAQRAGAHDDEEIDVIDCAVASLHINADGVFVPPKIRQSISMYRDQIKRDIFATRFNVKLLVGRFLSVRLDILFDAGEDLGIGYY